MLFQCFRSTSQCFRSTSLCFFLLMQIIKDFYNTSYHRRQGNTSSGGQGNNSSEYLTTTSISILWATTVSIFALGGMIGGLSAGYWCNRYGRYIKFPPRYQYFKENRKSTQFHSNMPFFSFCDYFFLFYGEFQIQLDF